MILTLDIAFSEGEIVYLKTDEDAQPRMVLGFDYRFGSIKYALTCAAKDTTYHFAEEITTDKTFILTL